MSKPLVIFVLFSLLVVSACSRTSSDGAPDGSIGTDGVIGEALVFSAEPSLKTALSRRDASALSKAESEALEFAQQGETVSWSGRSGSNRGTVEASSPFRVGRSTCRRLVHRIFLSSEARTADLTACKRPQSGWKLVQ